MPQTELRQQILARHIRPGDHQGSDYFAAIRELVDGRRAVEPAAAGLWQKEIDGVYALLRQEIRDNRGEPLKLVSFGTSGWRGLLGKDLFVHSVACVTAAIVELYRAVDREPALAAPLGLASFDEACRRGCVLGFDNRFGNEILAQAVANVLAANNIIVHYAGEATTGTLSAAVLQLSAAFSINLTPSHNPLEYGGFKYNAADAGPAASVLTNRITEEARTIIDNGGISDSLPEDLDLATHLGHLPGIQPCDALSCWQALVRANRELHGLDYDDILARFARNEDVVVAVDCVHGASRRDIARLLGGEDNFRLLLLRSEPDVTFGGIAPEPSEANMRPVKSVLAGRYEPLKLGAIIDPDGDRIRFTDGEKDISMNQFGAMAYHFLHQVKGRRGLVAKTVATSNLANAVAQGLGEEVFEPPVGFKEFKPVIGRALVCFEESDGISVIGHTPEKDAYIGLLLALDLTLSQGCPLGAYLERVENHFGYYYPHRDGVRVSCQGEELKTALGRLAHYGVGSTVQVGDKTRHITEVITIDGRKMILDDGSWLMIRPSGTEPKIRFYVEARSEADKQHLVETARQMLSEIGLLM